MVLIKLSYHLTFKGSIKLNVYISVVLEFQSRGRRLKQLRVHNKMLSKEKEKRKKEERQTGRQDGQT